ncbi:MAG: DUF5777 family beta-barrel protein [Saprospiraceae bacterium]|nr:DUF5777 family beta-barrel protein [Saprospiraceae bacterium]
MKQISDIGRGALTLLPVLLVCLLCQVPLSGQDAEEARAEDKPVRSMFNSTLLIDNQTAIVPIKGTLQMDIVHRFGTWDNGYDDFWGFFAPSNIKFGFSYVLVDNLSVGFGFTKNNLLWDFNAKYAILQQTRSGRVPVSLTYFGDMAIETRDKINYRKSGDRFSYFHQLMIARKISPKISLQVAPSLSHFNKVDAILDDNNEVQGLMENDHIAISVGGKWQITSGTAIIAHYDQPITDHFAGNPESNLSLGVEFVTSSHAFQVFIGNFSGIVPQYNNFLNRNSFGDNEILIGFNVTRLWNF